MMYQFFLALLMTLFLNNPANSSTAIKNEMHPDKTEEAADRPPYTPQCNLLLIRNQLKDDVIFGDPSSRQVVSIRAGSHKWFTIPWRNGYDVIYISYTATRSTGLCGCRGSSIVAHALFKDYELRELPKKRTYKSRKAFVTEQLELTFATAYIGYFLGTITLFTKDPRTKHK